MTNATKKQQLTGDLLRSRLKTNLLAFMVLSAVVAGILVILYKYHHPELHFKPASTWIFDSCQ